MENKKGTYHLLPTGMTYIILDGSEDEIVLNPTLSMAFLKLSPGDRFEADCIFDGSYLIMAQNIRKLDNG